MIFRTALAVALLALSTAAFAQTPSTVRLCNGTQPNCPLVSSTNPLPVSGSFTGSVSVGATAASALPSLSAGSQAFYESLSGGLYVQSVYGTTIVDLTHGLPVQPQTGSSWTVTGAGGTFPVTQSTSPWVVSNGGTFAVQAAITAASGSIASGSVSSGAFASGAVSSGAFASGALASGAMVDLVASQTPVAAASATATKGLLLGGQYDSTQKTLTTGQQAAFSASPRGAMFVAVGADGFAVTNAGTFAVQAAVTAASGAYASGSIASGAMVDLGAQADSACATDNGTCSEIALTKRGNQRLTTLNTTLGSPFQAGGSIGNTTFGATQGTSPWVVGGNGTAGTAASGVLSVQGIASMTPVQVSQATAANLNATVVGTGTFATQSAVTAASGSFASGAFASGSFASGSHASGSFASGAFASGSVASGAYASGSLASGAMVDLVALSAPVAPATATATKSVLLGAQATTAAVNPTTGQQGALSSDTNNNLLVSAGGAPNLTIVQVSIATSDTLAIAARALRRSVTIQQITGTQNVFCNQTTATAANGVVLPAVVGASITLNTTSAVRCIAITGAQTVAIAETY